MKLAEALAALEKAGTAQNRKVYARHGVGARQFGVSYAELGALTKRIRIDQTLAEGLWASGIHDARVLATMIADPEAIRKELLDAWAADLDCYPITDALSSLIARTPHARDRAAAWIADEREWIGQCGWNLIVHLAMKDGALDDAYFAEKLEIIEREIHGRKNRVRHAMNGALIAIGLRNELLRERALTAARAIGSVEVDHGETGCKTPDAIAYIERSLARQSRRATAKRTSKPGPQPAAKAPAQRTTKTAAKAPAQRTTKAAAKSAPKKAPKRAQRSSRSPASS